MDIDEPRFVRNTEYRLKPEPDPYQRLKEAHARGEQIEILSFGEWLPLIYTPVWSHPAGFYRIVPKKELPPKQAYSQESWRYGWVKKIDSEEVWAVMEIDSYGVCISQPNLRISWNDLMDDWECSETLYGTFRPCYR